MPRPNATVSNRNLEIIGSRCDHFQDTDNFRLYIGLNMTDEEAVTRNRSLETYTVKEDGGDAVTKSGVILLQNAYLASAPNRVFGHAVVVPRHAALEVTFACRSPVGYGFALRPTGDTKALDGESEIVPKLYGVDAPDGQGIRHETVRRFQGNTHRLLVVDPAADVLGRTVTTADAAQRWELEAQAWSVESYIDPITSRVYDATNPVRSGALSYRPESVTQPLARSALYAASVDALHVENVKPGVVVGRGKSDQSFTQIKVIKEGRSIGQIRLTIFVI